MENKDFSQFTDEELLVEKKKLKNSKIFHATMIGILAGILIYGFGAWFMSSERQFGFLIPMIFPIVFIYKLLKKPKSNSNLEEALKTRGL